MPKVVNLLTNVVSSSTSLPAVILDGNYVPAGSTKTLNVTDHYRATVLLDTAAGSTVTLPAATGSGVVFRFVVTVSCTSNNHVIKVANANDTMVGTLLSTTIAGTAPFSDAAGGTDDTITLGPTTTSGLIGGVVLVEDVKPNVWLIDGRVIGSGTLITSLSATV
jgi:hypothetical protein